METKRSAVQGGTCGPCIVKADRNRQEDREAREVENVPMLGGIMVTKHQVTLIEEVVRLALLRWGGTTILVVLEVAGDGRLSSY